MVWAMASRDPAARPDTEGASLLGRPFWRRLYERARDRAEAAEARSEALKWAEVSARCDAGFWKWQFESSRRKRLAAVERSKDARRAARDALALRAEVARLDKLLADAGVASDRYGVMSLRREVARLRKAAPGAEVQAAEIRRLHKVLWKERIDKAAVRRVLDETVRLYAGTRRLRDQQDRVQSLSDDVGRLRYALQRSEAVKGRLKARLHRRAEAARALSPAAADESLRKALGRSRRRKATIGRLRKENARLRRTVQASRRRIGTQELELAKLRATRAVLSKALRGRKSEQRERPRTGRPRGQRRGAPGHGRTPRCGLEERVEERSLPAAARTCSGCGKPYAAVGVAESALVEIEVRAYRRVIRRPRWRRGCECASSPAEVSAPPAPRLFANTPYGTSVWSRVLYERYACLRPLQRVGAWLGDQGLPVSSGTLADSVPRFVPLFEPVAGAILAHQHAAVLCHADETTWRVQALRGEGGSGRAWLWTAVGNDAVRFHVDASRSAEAAAKLFGDLAPETVIVCDRYSAYKRLARLLGGTVVLAFCWAHMRRDFIQCAAAQVRLTGWCEAWLARIAAIYRLNEARLACYDPGIEHQSAAFDAAQGALAAALDGLFATAQRELASLPEHAREGKPLRSLVNHREGLSVFADRPRVPLDNNLAERLLRGPAIGRRLSFGSDSTTGARFTALMYSVVGTLMLNRIDVLRWLEAWLAACADNGGRPPDDTAAWLPWSMDGARRRALTAPT
jgi:transposase